MLTHVKSLRIALLPILVLILGKSTATAVEMAELIIANLEKLDASLPEVGLAEDLFDSLGMDDLKSENDRNNPWCPNARERITMLVRLVSPNNITHTRSQGPRLAVGPVDDFRAFAASIDFGRASVSESNRTITVSVDPKEISRENLIARARQSGRRPQGLLELMGKAKPDSDASLKVPVGSRVKFYLRDAEVFGTLMGDERFRTAVVSVTDCGPLANLVKSRGLRRKLDRVDALYLRLPLEMIEGAGRSGPATEAAPQPRTWTDKSGKFSVIATYAGASGERIRLVRNGGKEVLVPIERLSERDQKYLHSLRSPGQASGTTAAASAIREIKRGGSKRLTAKWTGLKQVKGKDFSEWSFAPPAREPSPKMAAPAAKSIAFPGVASLGWETEELETLFVAADGRSAIAVVFNGEFFDRDKRRYVQYLDFAAGTAAAPVKLPEKATVIDALPSQKRLILKYEGSSRDGLDEQVQVHRVTAEGIEPLVSWEVDTPYEVDHRYDEAWLLHDGRVMTKGSLDGFIVWDQNKARALFEIPIGNTKSRSRVRHTLDPSRRYLAITTDVAIAIIDLSRGRHVATIEHQIHEADSVAISGDLSKIALLGKTQVSSWDLNTGELLVRVAVPSKRLRNQSLEWAGDLLLLGGQYLIDPKRRVLLWQYELSAGRSGDQFTVAIADRLWYAPKEDPAFGLYLASVPVPHEAVQSMQDKLGSGNDLLVAQPGDEIHLTVDTDLDQNSARQLAQAVSESLTKAGYRVLESEPSSPSALQAVVSCKKQSRQEIRINMSSSPFPDAWDVVTRTIEPYFSFVAIRRGEVELWSRGWKAGPHAMIFVNKGETLDDALRRITTPDTELIENLVFASHLATPGQATPEGAYGVSRLSKDGVIRDYTGE